MSAYLQTNEHFNVISSYFASNISEKGLWTELNGNYNYLTPETAEVVFWILVNENTRSLQARYPESPDMWEAAKQYAFTYIPDANRLYSVGEIAMALDGLEYQSCETDDYYQSEAHRIVQNMRKHLLTQLEDYEMSETWTIDKVKNQEARYL